MKRLLLGVLTIIAVGGNTAYAVEDIIYELCSDTLVYGIITPEMVHIDIADIKAGKIFGGDGSVLVSFRDGLIGPIGGDLEGIVEAPVEAPVEAVAEAVEKVGKAVKKACGKLCGG